MSNTKIVLNRAGVRELLESEEMKRICREHADKARNELGFGYEVTEYMGRDRVKVSIHAKSEAAKKENIKKNTILKAVK